MILEMASNALNNCATAMRRGPGSDRFDVSGSRALPRSFRQVLRLHRQCFEARRGSGLAARAPDTYAAPPLADILTKLADAGLELDHSAVSERAITSPRSAGP
jgi:hypothetical protein